MSKVMPFKGLRPKKDIAHKLAELPYDVVNSSEAKKIAEGNIYSFFHVSKPEIDLPADTEIHSQIVYDTARKNLDRFIGEGYIFQEDKPCFYIYREIMPYNNREFIQTGLVACASCEEYEKDTIKKHELTRKDKEDDRTKHIEVLESQTGPVFLTYIARKTIDELISKLTAKEPAYKFTSSDNVEHIFWVINDDKDINEIRKEFEKTDILYVADGHHRSASAVRVMKKKRSNNKNHTGNEEYNFFLSVIFPHDQMNILEYNRLVKDLNGLTEKELIEKINDNFEIKNIGKINFKPSKEHSFGMYLNSNWYELTAKKNSYNAGDPVESLDVSILQNNLLDRILGIKDPRTDKRIDFVGGIRGLDELVKRVDSGDFALAFSMYPTSIDQLINVSKAGKIMPPKSTWFEPKLRDGLVIHNI